MDKSNYFLIDILKAIFALCVIAIHTNPLTDYVNQTVLSIYNLIISMSVPFFFTITGFLAAKKMDDIEYIKNIRCKYIRLYLLWNLAYLPITIWGFVFRKTETSKIAYSWLRGFFLIGE